MSELKCTDAVANFALDIHHIGGFGLELSTAIATDLYEMGYRKNEWISVEDSKPTHKDGKVLIYTAYGISIAEVTISGHWRGSCAIPKFITHWMPLPRAPKGE